MTQQPKPIIQDIQGKAYEPVISRERRFRADHPLGGLRTHVMYHDDTKIICTSVCTASSGEILGEDVAEERYGDSFINKKSAVENCATSAKGRALGSAGYNAGDEVASYEEVAQARHSQASESKPSSLPTPQRTAPVQPAPVQHAVAVAPASPPPAPAPVGADGKVTADYFIQTLEEKELIRKSDGEPFPKFIGHTDDGVKMTTLRKIFGEMMGTASHMGVMLRITHLPPNRWGDCDIKDIEQIQAPETREIPDDDQDNDLPF